MRADRPNIVLVMTDQHRADAMGCAGDPVVQTPTMDDLASRGVRFGRAYCQGPLCMPARASLLSERYVRDHGVSGNATAVSPETPTFLHALRQAGYLTACVGKMHLYVHGGRSRDTRHQTSLLRTLGFDDSVEVVGKVASLSVESEYSDYLRERGLFDSYRRWLASRTPERMGTSVRVDGKEIQRLPIWQTAAFPLPAEAYLDSWIGRRSARWIEEYEDSRPFFLWVGFAGPHNPWDAPAAYVERYRGADVRGLEGARPELPLDGPFRRFLEGRFRHSESDGLTDDVVKEIRRFYYANVTLIDEAMGAILGVLERRNFLDNTWVIYTTDHGEMLGEHGFLTKQVFYEASTRVPLIIRPAGGVEPRTFPGLVQHVDLSATIRDIAAAPSVPGSEGLSLRGTMAGDPTPVREVAFSENLGFGMVVGERYKLVFHEATAAPVQLFDLQEDPAEDRNLVADPARGSLLAELMAQSVLPFLAGERPVGGS